MSNFTLETLYLPFDFDQTERRVRIYLPQHYETSNKRYPVLYMHDGQNVLYDEESYSIVGSAEANPLQGKISNDSPIAKALLGKRVGDEVSIATPGGDMKVKIVNVTVL